MFREDTDIPEFEVQKVLAKRVVKNVVEYLVLWKGYPPHEATWEPYSNLSNAQCLVDEFERNSVQTRRQRAQI